MSGRCSVVLVLLALASLAVANHDLECPGETCPEKNFTFTCTGELGELTWVVENGMNVQVGNYTVYNDTLLGADDTFENNDQFMVRRVTNNSTRLWFPANLNYTGYTVRCIDDDNDDNDVMACMNLQVTGPPTMPESFTINTGTLNRTSVRLNWQAPLNYDCVITYYNITVNGMNYILNSNYTWFDLPVNFGLLYCPMISARDTVMRLGAPASSTPRCIDVNVPPAVILNENSYSYRPGEFVNITVSWTMSSTDYTPTITNYTVSYNETYRDDMGSGSGSDMEDNNREVAVPAGQTSVILRASFREQSTYFVEVTPSNMFGVGAPARMVFTIPVAPRPTTPTTMVPESDGGLSVGAIVGIAIGAIVGVALIVVVVVVVIVIVVVAGGKKKANKSTELTKL